MTAVSQNVEECLMGFIGLLVKNLVIWHLTLGMAVEQLP